MGGFHFGVQLGNVFFFFSLCSTSSHPKSCQPSFLTVGSVTQQDLFLNCGKRMEETSSPLDKALLSQNFLVLASRGANSAHNR